MFMSMPKGEAFLVRPRPCLVVAGLAGEDLDIHHHRMC
jgi:hypothetical protein